MVITAPSKQTFLLASNAAYSPNSPATLAENGFSALLGANGAPLTMTTSNGTVAAAYKDGNGNVIIAYQGTNPSLTNLGQDSADLTIEKNETPQGTFDDALTFAGEVEQVANAQGFADSQIYVTGHSLGGIEAEYVASQTGFGGASFGATGLPGYDGSAQNTNFTNYINYGDPVGNLANDSFESSVITGSMYHYGAVSYVGDPSAGDNLQEGADSLAVNNATGYDTSYALSVLALDLSNHLLGSYASILGVQLPSADPAPLPSIASFLTPLLVPLGGRGTTDLDGASVTSSGGIDTPDFDIQVSSNGTYTVTQNQPISVLPSSNFNTSVVTNIAVNASAGEVTSLSDASTSGTVMDNLTNNYSSGSSVLTDYAGQASGVTSNAVTFTGLDEQGVDSSQTIAMTNGILDQFLFDTATGIDSPVATVNSNGSITSTANNVTANLGPNTILNDGGSSETVNGNGLQIGLDGSSGQTLNATGANDTIGDNSTGDTVTASYDTIDLLSGTSASQEHTLSVFGTGDTVGESEYDNVTLSGNHNALNANGPGDLLNDYGSGDVVTGNGVIIGLDEAGGDQGLTTTGTGDTILDYTDGNTLTGTDETLDFSNGSETLYLDGTGNTTNGYSGDRIEMGANSSATVNDNGQTIYLNGNGATLTTSGSNDNVQDYDSAEVVGGNGVTINLDAAGGEEGLTTTGTGDAISDYSNLNTVTGSNDTLTFSNGSETVFLNGANEAINGQSGDTTDLGANSSASFGTNNSGETIGLDASGDTVTVDGSENTVNDFGASDTVDGSTAVQINLDSSGTLTAGDTSDILTDYGASDTVNGNGLQITLDGADGQIVDATGTGATVGENNSGDTVDASYDYVDTLGGSSGQDQTLTTSGTADQIGAATYDNVTIFGDSNTLTSYGSNNTANLAGTGDTIAGNSVTIGLDGSSAQTLDANGTGDTIGENSSGDLITGSSEAIYLSGGSSASQIQTSTIDGSGNETNAGNYNTLAINGGTDNTFLGTSDTAFVSGNVSQIDSDGYNELSGDKIVFNNTTSGTSQLQEVDPTSATSLGSFDYSETDAQGNLNEANYNYDSGISAATFYNPSSTITIETEDFSQINDGGNRTSLTFDSTNGDSYDDSFVYSGSTLDNYYQTVGNSQGHELSEEEFNASGAVVDDIYGSGSYGGYTPSPSGGYGTYGDAMEVSARSGADISSISAARSGKSAKTLSWYHADPRPATFTSANESAPKSLSDQAGSSTLSTTQAASIDAAAQARIASMIQAMARFGTMSSSLQTSIQASLKELHEPVLAAAASSH